MAWRLLVVREQELGRDVNRSHRVTQDCGGSICACGMGPGDTRSGGTCSPHMESRKTAADRYAHCANSLHLVTESQVQEIAFKRNFGCEGKRDIR
jgi:hypothetical protein